jgi:hypothetical protein
MDVKIKMVKRLRRKGSIAVIIYKIKEEELKLV